MTSHPPTPPLADDDSIDISELLGRVRRGLALTLGLAFVGLAVGATVLLLTGPFQNVSTATRVVFSFPGFERGEYPDRSKFSPDDLRSPEIIAEALKRKGLDTSADTQAKVRAALSIEAIIPESVIKERDKLRAAGQTPRVYIADEYAVTLTLPRKFPLSLEQRQQLLGEIVNRYQAKFKRTYVDMPVDFGNAFETLRDADFFEYELILNTELQNILAYLDQHLALAQEGERRSDEILFNSSAARAFRSPTTNLSFSDLVKQTQLFAQIKLNETLGLIRQHGLSKDRAVALIKMDYYLRTLQDQELKATEEEKVVQDLLNKTRERGEGYVLGVKSQAAQSQPGSPMLDQGLIDSLLANDAYNFLVRQALTAGLKVKRIQAEKAVLLERRKNMEAFLKGDERDQSAINAQVTKSLAAVEASYRELIENIRKTHDDFVGQQLAGAIRVSMQAHTGSFYRSLAMAGVAGLGIGAALGLGLSLLDIGIGRGRSTTA